MSTQPTTDTNNARPEILAMPRMAPQFAQKLQGAFTIHAHLHETDPACLLHHVPAAGLAGRPEYLLSNSFGFGGINAALVFRRADGR